jgi:hypothetical protein
VRIPTKTATDSDRKRPRLPIEGGQRFRSKAATGSGEGGQGSVVGWVKGSGRGQPVKGGLVGADLSHGFSLQVEAVGVVYEAVEDGVGEGGIADQAVPFVDGQLARDEGGFATMPVIEDLEEVPALVRSERREAPIVENEEIEPLRVCRRLFGLSQAALAMTSA